MRIISRRSLRRFSERHPRSYQPLLAWYEFVRRQNWSGPADVKVSFRTADTVGGNRVVFNVGGNKFRLVAEINHKSRCIFVRFVGTHAEYDKIDVTTIKNY